MSDMQAERNNGNLVIRPTGKIDGGNSGGVQREIGSIIDRQDQAVILDLARIEYLSSAGLRVIAVTLNRCRSRSQQLALCNAMPNIYKILNSSGFDKLLPIADS